MDITARPQQLVPEPARQPVRPKVRQTVRRSAGLGLLVYGIGNVVGFMASGSPGGDYAGATVTRYVGSGHLALAGAFWYLVALSGLGLLVAAPALRELRRIGGFLGGLATVGASLAVTGAFISGGVAIAAAEGGRAVRTGVALPVFYTLTEIGNLVAVCGPALCLGVAALALAWQGPLPTWLRVSSAVAGVCGIFAPFFFTYVVYVLWTVVLGITWARRRAGAPATVPEPSSV